jgi:DNA-binding LacI/PurR family transcriptional regulator
LALAETGYHLMLLSPEGTDRTIDAFVRVAMQHSLDGIALMAADSHLPAVNALIASGRPCVGLDLPIHGHRATYVSSDNRAGAPPSQSGICTTSDTGALPSSPARSRCFRRRPASRDTAPP